MSEIRRNVFECNVCGARRSVGLDSTASKKIIKQFDKGFYNEGWKEQNGKQYCPEHAKEDL